MGRKTARVSLPAEATDAEVSRLQEYLNEMPMAEVLQGLEFARNRWRLQDSGTLRVGRKGVVSKEVQMVTAEQARWRLDNWKLMVANYRRLGYSYPTISRIKKRLSEKAGTLDHLVGP